MSFDNRDYPNRKDRRRPYRGSKRFDRSCRNHGSCGYCYNNRTHANRKRVEEAKSKIDDYMRL